MTGCVPTFVPQLKMYVHQLEALLTDVLDSGRARTYCICFQQIGLTGLWPQIQTQKNPKSKPFKFNIDVGKKDSWHKTVWEGRMDGVMFEARCVCMCVQRLQGHVARHSHSTPMGCSRWCNSGFSSPSTHEEAARVSIYDQSEIKAFLSNHKMILKIKKWRNRQEKRQTWTSVPLPVGVTMVLGSEDWQQPAEEQHHQGNSCNTHNWHTHNVKFFSVQNTKQADGNSDCGRSVLFLLPMSRSEEAASHSRTIPVVMAASDGQVKVNAKHKTQQQQLKNRAEIPLRTRLLPGPEWSQLS